MLKNKNNIIILVVVILVIAFAIMYLRKSITSEDVSLATDAQVSNSADATYVYTLLKKMSFVKLDDSIFASQLFNNLKDNTVTLGKQEVGRPNPFAPIGNDVGSIATTTR